MMNILKKLRINNYTYLFLFICMLCGFIKNILIIFFICIVHEFGHIFFIKLFKYNIIRIEIFPFGGFTTIDKKINTSINKDLLIGLGGIIFQLVLIIITFIFKNNFNTITYNLMMYYNIILIIFNLIPIIPLDGNNIIHLLLEKFFSFRLSYYLNFIISVMSLVIFTIINYIYNLDNYFIVSFLIYKTIIYIKNYKFIYNRFLLERYLYDFQYSRINNRTRDLNGLRKDVLHYFKNKNKYISESTKLKEYFNNNL